MCLSKELTVVGILDHSSTGQIALCFYQTRQIIGVHKSQQFEPILRPIKSVFIFLPWFIPVTLSSPRMIPHPLSSKPKFYTHLLFSRVPAQVTSGLRRCESPDYAFFHFRLKHFRSVFSLQTGRPGFAPT